MSILEKENLYIVGFNNKNVNESLRKIKIMTKDGYLDYVDQYRESLNKLYPYEYEFGGSRSRITGGEYNTNGIPTLYQNTDDISITEEALLDFNFESYVYKEYYDLPVDAFIEKNTSGGPNKYYNTLGTNDYEIIDGFVVPSKDNVSSMNVIKNNFINQKNYCILLAEQKIFRLNNPSCKFYHGASEKGKYPSSKYKKGTFNTVGEPLWITRDPEETAIDFLGNTLYPLLTATSDKYKKYTNNSDWAFLGWSTVKPVVISDLTDEYGRTTVVNNKTPFLLVDIEYRNLFLK